MIKLPNPYKQWMRGAYTSRQEIQKLIKDTTKVCGIEEIYPDIRWSFSARLVKAIGTAQWWQGDHGMVWQLKFASQLWMGMGTDDRKNTIVHEVCHLAVEKIHGHCNPEVRDHGPHWKEMMWKCGEDPDMITYGNW